MSAVATSNQTTGIQNLSEEADVPIADLYYDISFNCRGNIAGHTVVTLANDIQARGLMQRIIVHPVEGVPGKVFKVLAGHRRYLAIRSLNWPTVPCKILRGLTELQQRTINLKENVERAELNILQEARGIEPYKIAHWNARMISEELNQPMGWVQTRLNLLRLEPEIQLCAAAGILTQQQIAQLAKMPAGECRYEAVKKIKASKARGERAIDIKPQVKRNPLKRMKRNPAEASFMTAHIMDTLGPCLASRLGAWYAGEIADIDFYRSLAAECEKAGKPYAIPEDSMPVSL